MICPKCSKEISDDSLFCPECGSRLGENSKMHIEKVKKPVNKKLVIGIVVAVIAVAGIGVGVYFNSTPEAKYHKAEKAFEDGNYEKAVKYYSAVGDYEDAAEKLIEAEQANHHAKGLKLMEEEAYEEAKGELKEAQGYQNSDDLIKECCYKIAQGYVDEGDYISAAASFKDAKDYEDANDRILSLGQELVTAENYEDAVTVFEYATNWPSDPYAQYANGMVNLASKNYSQAAEYFERSGDILDAKSQFNEAEYLYASDQFDEKKYSTAQAVFRRISEYKDSAELMNACGLLAAQEEIDKGNLNAAKVLLEPLASEYSYNGVSVSSLLDTLNANERWLAVCGKWSNTSGEASTNCKARNYSYDGGTWTNTLEPGTYTIDIKCILNNDGTVTVSGTGSIIVFTNWSTIQMGLDYDRNYSISFNKTIPASDFGTQISINDYTKITLGTDKITVNYSETDDNSTVNFVYYYNTNVTYGTKITAH